METVTWKLKGYYKADANKAYAEISALKDITPHNVVDLARNPSSEIHNDFEWNDAIAGEKYRETQAQRMIRMFTFEREEKSEEPVVRAFEISTERNTYKPREFFFKNDDEYGALLAKACDEARAFANRYKTLAEMRDVVEAIENL
jgi:hypothetical protein